jgi:hypothetical protein
VWNHITNLNYKTQIPNAKCQTNSNDQNSNFQTLELLTKISEMLKEAPCLPEGFGHWSLEFEIYL